MAQNGYWKADHYLMSHCTGDHSGGTFFASQCHPVTPNGRQTMVTDMTADDYEVLVQRHRIVIHVAFHFVNVLKLAHFGFLVNHLFRYYFYCQCRFRWCTIHFHTSFVAPNFKTIFAFVNYVKRVASLISTDVENWQNCKCSLFCIIFALAT